MWKNSQETEAAGILGPIKRSEGSRERGGSSLNAGFATRCAVLQDAEFLSVPEDRMGMEKKATEATRKKKKLKMYEMSKQDISRKYLKFLPSGTGSNLFLFLVSGSKNNG